MNQLKAGALLSYVNLAATVAVGLLYTPVMLRLLGQSEYGLYSLIGAFVGYLSILDMGLGNTIVRYASGNRVTGDKQKEAELNGLFLLIYLALGAMAAAAGIFLCLHLDWIFGDSLTAGELREARIMMALLVFNLALSFPLGLFSAEMQVYERFIFLRATNILRVILNPFLVLPFLYMGYGAVMMVIISTVLNISCLLANMWYCFHYLELHFIVGHYKKAFLTEIAVYSFFIFLNAVMDKVYYNTGQFILGIVDGTEAVAVYAVAIQFVMLYMQFSTALSGVLFPKITRMVAGKATKAELTDIMIRVGRLQCMVVAYILVMFYFVGKDFIILWAGPRYEGAYGVTLLIMAGLFTPLIQNAGISILWAMNRNKYRMTVYILCALASIGISYPLAEIWGGLGCALGTFLSLAVSTGFIMNRYYDRVIGLDMGTFWKEIIKEFRGIALFAAAAYGMLSILPPRGGWLSFLGTALLLTVMYGTFLYGWSLNSYEKGLCRSVGKKFYRKEGS